MEGPILVHASVPGRFRDGSGGTVLYIEDNVSNMRLLENVFEGWKNFRLIPAAYGSLGLELAREHLPDLILLDLHLPDLTGEEVLRRLKSEPVTQSIPVVVLSADATKKQIQTLRSCGAIDYLTKPIDLKRLIAILEEYEPTRKP